MCRFIHVSPKNIVCNKWKTSRGRVGMSKGSPTGWLAGGDTFSKHGLQYEV